MRIGLFTDTFRPSINGIVYVVESLMRELEALGHDVYVFCPGKKILPSNQTELYEDDTRIIRFTSVKGAFFDDYDTSIFFPPRVVQQIKTLNLDIVHVLTPSQVGLVGIQAAVKNDIPFMIQHSTDLYEFSEDYPMVLPGLLAMLAILLPTTVKLNRKDVAEVVKLYRPRRGMAKWNKDIVQKAVTMLYSRADAVIALSEKSANQLRSWQNENYSYEIVTLPSGVDALPAPSTAQVMEFLDTYDIAPDDEVFGFVGRLGKEKNLDMLIPALKFVLAKRPNARLMFVGDFEYRETLETAAAECGYGDRITFTGAIAREKLGVAYAAMKVFVFPSLKDTQGWVLHEAPLAGLPVVLLDKGVTSAVIEGENGFYVDNMPEAVAAKVIALLEDDKLYTRMSKRSVEIASQFTEASQVKKLEVLCREVIKNHNATERVG